MHKIAFILILSLTTAYGSVLKHQSVEISSPIDLSKFKSVKAGEYDSADTVVYKSTGGIIIKIRKSDLKGRTDKDKQKVFNKNIAQYKLLFQDRVSPYTGGVTVNTECADKQSTRHKIVKSNHSVMTKFETMATANLVYGKCDGDKSGYHSAYIMILCNEQALYYDIKFFSKNNDDLKNLDVKCVN